MTIVESVSRLAELPHEQNAFQRDAITLTWEERRRGHGRRRSDSGLEFAISLPLGTILKAGDGFVLMPERTVVEIREAMEPVYVVRPETPQQWAYYAYHAGNRHQPVMIGEAELIFPRDPAVRSLFEQLQAPFKEDARPFTAALAQPGHTPP